MEQLQIRQPKMPAAQSFIQILGTFLATLFIFKEAYFSYIKKTSLIKEQPKRLLTLGLALKRPTSFNNRRNFKGA